MRSVADCPVIGSPASPAPVFGGVFGLAGTMTAQPKPPGNTAGYRWLWACDACALLTLKFHRMGSEIVSGGFLVFSIGEGVTMSGTAAGANTSVPSFGAGVALWAAALLLISIPKQFPSRVRGRHRRRQPCS